jgi:hypothetical protein
MRKLSEKEKLEAKTFVITALQRQYGSDAGWLTIAAKDLKMNYSQLANIVSGRTMPTRALLDRVGYVTPAFITPLGNPYTTGVIIEVELDSDARALINDMRRFFPEYEWDKQYPKILSKMVSDAVRVIRAKPQNYLKIREKTPEERKLWDDIAASDARTKTQVLPALGDDFEPDAESEELDVFG